MALSMRYINLRKSLTGDFTKILRCWASSLAEHKEGVRLVWPPPAHLATQLGLDSTTDAPSSFDALQQSGLRSHEASQSGAQTQTQNINVDRSRRLRELLQMHAIEAGSLSKSYIAKLPVKVIREELMSWGTPLGLEKKPALVELMAASLQLDPANKPESGILPEARASDQSPETMKDTLESISVPQIKQWLAEARTDDIIHLDVSDGCSFASDFIIASGRSQKHIFTTATGLAWRAKQIAGSDSLQIHVEGKEGGEWMAVDIDGTIVHIFTEEARQEYNLESLWAPSAEIIEEFAPLSQAITA